MRASRWPARALALVIGGAAAGCQIYLSGGPGTAPAPPTSFAASAASPTNAPAAPDTDTAADRYDAPPAAPAASPPPTRPATFPGERYYEAGATWVVLEAVEDALASRDFRILRSGTSTRGGEVHAERRERLAPAPRTTTSPAWKVHAAVVRIAGTSWDDCCYVRAAFTTTHLSPSGDVLGTTAADEPENDVLRTWFLDDLGTRIPPPPSR